MAIAQDKLHPRARAIVDQIAALPALPTLSPEAARGRPAPLAAAPEAVGSVTARTIPGPGGPMPIRIYRPKNALRAALVYFHGGGWVVGSLESADGSCRAIANRSRCVVISIGYRLAPETKFPGAVEDAYAAVRWVSSADHAAELRIDPVHLAVGGSSAGGNLAAVAALVSRDRNGPKIAFQLLTVPVAELSARARSYQEFAEGYGLTRADMEWYGRHYVRTAADADDPYASVLRADLHGLPPAFVITAECDPLRDDGEAYAEKLQKLGVRASYKRYPGMFHGFMSFPEVLPEATQAFEDAGAALREALS
jgi:acetyl esterase